MSLYKILSAANTEGFSFRALYAEEIDYEGDNIREMITAMNACDEMEFQILNSHGRVIGWGLFIPGLEADEQIADCSGWVNYFMEND